MSSENSTGQQDWAAYSSEKVFAFEERCLTAVEVELALRRTQLEQLGYILVPLVVSRRGTQPFRPDFHDYESQIDVCLRRENDPMFPNYVFYRCYPVWTSGKGPETTSQEVAEAVRQDLNWLLAKLFGSGAVPSDARNPKSATK